MTLSIIDAGPNQIDVIQPLWESLNRHHSAVSAHFKERFKKFTFDQRKESLLDKAKSGKMRIFMAMNNNHAVGYCVTSIDQHGNGEIESLFVEESFRKQGIADRLMHKAMAWLKAMKVTSTSISVVAGNEEVFDFYERHGFLPRDTRLLRHE